MVNKLVVKRKKGFIVSVTNPKAKKKGTVYLVQRGMFPGWTPVRGKNWTRVKGVQRGRTERTAVKNVLEKGYRKVVFAD